MRVVAKQHIPRNCLVPSVRVLPVLCTTPATRKISFPGRLSNQALWNLPKTVFSWAGAYDVSDHFFQEVGQHGLLHQCPGERGVLDLHSRLKSLLWPPSGFFWQAVGTEIPRSKGRSPAKALKP